MILLKDALVIHQGLQPEMYFALGVASALKQKMFALNCVVTSLLDGAHNPGSKHPLGFAGDIRTLDLTIGERGAYFEAVKGELEHVGFDVVPEVTGSTPATTQVHMHIEFQPKDRQFWHQLGDT